MAQHQFTQSEQELINLAEVDELREAYENYVSKGDTTHEEVVKAAAILTRANDLGYQLVYVHATLEEYAKDPSGHVEVRPLNASHYWNCKDPYCTGC